MGRHAWKTVSGTMRATISRLEPTSRLSAYRNPTHRTSARSSACACAPRAHGDGRSTVSGTVRRAARRDDPERQRRRYHDRRSADAPTDHVGDRPPDTAARLAASSSRATTKPVTLFAARSRRRGEDTQAASGGRIGDRPATDHSAGSPPARDHEGRRRRASPALRLFAGWSLRRSRRQ